MLNKIFLASLSFAFLTLTSFCQQKPLLQIISQAFIYDTASFSSCHASTITETPEGLIAAWFGGTHEKHKDVEIWVSRKRNGKWSAPVSVANGIQGASTRYPCWNPVLFQYPGGPLMLFYKVGPDPIDWWGELKTSYDYGKTWSKSVRLPEGIIGPVKNKPILISDGRLICPSSTESKDGRWQVHLEITKDTGKTWVSSGPLNDGLKYHIIQPSLLLYPDRQQLLCRSQENRIVTLWATDGVRNWSKPDTTSLFNPNAGTDAVTLNNGWQLLVYNPTEKTSNNWGGPRSPLHVAISKDGIVWNDVLMLENAPGEYSYPAVIQSKDSMVHITYTWNRKKIKWVAVKIMNDGRQISLEEKGLSTEKSFIGDTSLKDKDGNNYGLRIMSDNKLWMMDNIKINIPESYCYGDMKNCDRYGRLYTWESAQKACSLLGEGWQLPTSDEWRQMAKQFGGVFGDSQDSGKAAYKALLDGGSAAFDVLLGGGRAPDGKYARLDAHGFYWTATETNSTTAWFCNFGKGSAKFYLQNDGEKPRAFSVRCVRDAQILK